jgi:hypothetical protein
VPNVPQAWESFWTHPMEVLVDVGHVKSCLGLFGDSISFSARLVLGLRKRTIGSGIILDTPDGTPR